MSTLLFADSFKIKRQIAGEVGKEDEPMTIEEKIKRYRGIPKLLKDLQIDKEICTSVKSVQFDSIGEAKGTHGNSTEKKLIDAAEISEKIAALQQERDRLELSIMQHIANGTLAEAEVKFSNKAACCVIMASEGYPGKYETGYEITLPADSSRIFVAGAKIKDGKLVTGGGRVLGVTEVADTLAEAVDKAYETVKTVSFANAYYRKDIGKKALAAEV